jgi:hypothetical protein
LCNLTALDSTSGLSGIPFPPSHLSSDSKCASLSFESALVGVAVLAVTSDSTSFKTASSSNLPGSVREWLPIEELTNVPPSHQNHPQIRLIAADYPTNQKRYAYLRWEVTHPATPIVWRNGEWLELLHSEHTGHPYHTGTKIEVYPSPLKDDEEDLAEDLINL